MVLWGSEYCSAASQFDYVTWKNEVNMTSIEAIQSAINDIAVVSVIGGEIYINTHCLYPSNSAVSVVVRGSGNAYVVTDDGGAIGEVHSAGMREDPNDRQIRALVKSHGLDVKGGVIYSPPVNFDEISSAVLLVANASKEVADWSLAHLRFTQPRNFRRDLSTLLQRHFHDNLKPDVPVLGASNKPHKFGHVVYLPNDRRLLVDPVVNDPSSINARVVANLDVRMAKNPNLKQIIIFDDSLHWTSSDLKLLEVGAPIMPFSAADGGIDRLAA